MVSGITTGESPETVTCLLYGSLIVTEAIGEKEFVNIVGCFWAEGNDKIDLAKYLHTDGSWDNDSKIEKMIQYLDKGKRIFLNR